MPAPLAKGIIITVSVLIAAGLAAYESPEIRKWVDNSRRKIAMALHSLGDEINPKARESKKHDPSMDEDKSDEAEERRRQARAEIMERGRILEERRRSKATESTAQSNRDSGVGSFDSLIDEDGNLRKDLDIGGRAATTTAIEPAPGVEGLIKRGADSSAQGASRPNDSAQPPNAERLTTSNYEDELRENWNLPLPPITTAASETSHPSESVLDLTPTSEFPDPDFSVPDPTSPSQHSEFFSIPPACGAQEDPAASLSRSRTISPDTQAPAQNQRPSDPPSRTVSLSSASSSSPSYYYAHPSAPHQPLPEVTSSTPPQSPRQQPPPQLQHLQREYPILEPNALSSTLSVADTSDLEHVHASELSSMAGSAVGDFESEGENGDGMRTPEGSVWTDVGSSVSGDR